MVDTSKLTAFGKPVVPELNDKKPPWVWVSQESLTIGPTLTLTDVKVSLPFRNGIIRRLLLLLPPRFNQLLDGSMPIHSPLQQKQILLWDPSILRSLHSNLHAIRMGHQELGIGRLERISHLLDIVRRTSARDLASDS